MCWGQRPSGRMQVDRRGNARASAPPGHPAQGRYRCRGRSPGSRVIASCRPSRRYSPVTLDDSRLAAHSCGGSSGIAKKLTGFPLSSTRGRVKNHDTDKLQGWPEGVKIYKEMLISLFNCAVPLNAQRRNRTRNSRSSFVEVVPLKAEGGQRQATDPKRGGDRGVSAADRIRSKSAGARRQDKCPRQSGSRAHSCRCR
ncbi:hypothetical protein LMIY3S_00200 [Labrys miyagiensis]